MYYAVRALQWLSYIQHSTYTDYCSTKLPDFVSCMLCMSFCRMHCHATRTKQPRDRRIERLDKLNVDCAICVCGLQFADVCSQSRAAQSQRAQPVAAIEECCRWNQKMSCVYFHFVTTSTAAWTVTCDFEVNKQWQLSRAVLSCIFCRREPSIP